jgi:membrane-associated protein
LELLLQLVSWIVHIDQFLGDFIAQYGAWIYLALFLVIFCETGLIVFPFLPGDSLLFVAGAFCATGAVKLPVLIILLLVAAILGNTVNYWVGRAIGIKALESNWRLVNRSALQKTHHFYQRHGGKTIVLARFFPILRTFVPFVAGIGAMRATHFQCFNVLGALLWILSLVLAGYFFGNLPFVQRYLNVIILIGISAAIVPLLVGICWKWARRDSSRVL